MDMVPASISTAYLARRRIWADDDDNERDWWNGIVAGADGHGHGLHKRRKK